VICAEAVARYTRAMASTVDAAALPLIDRVPLAVCGAGLGLLGLAQAWMVAAPRLGAPAGIGDALAVLGLAVAALIVAVQVVRTVRRPDLARAELRDPVSGPVVGTAPMMLSVAATVVLPFAPEAALVLVLVAAALHTVVALVVVCTWITATVAIEHVHPGWFLPVAGVLTLVPPAVAVGQTDVAWCAMGFGAVLWLPLFALILVRLIRAERLPNVYMPALFVLFAPPALLFNAYVALTGGLDPFAHVVLHSTTTTALLVAALAPLWWRAPFTLVWWATTFPMAALTVALITYVDLHGGATGRAMAIVLLAATTALVAVVLGRSLLALRAGTMFPRK